MSHNSNTLILFFKDDAEILPESGLAIVHDSQAGNSDYRLYLIDLGKALTTTLPINITRPVHSLHMAGHMIIWSDRKRVSQQDLSTDLVESLYEGQGQISNTAGQPDSEVIV